jgi:hypothetical protein
MTSISNWYLKGVGWFSAAIGKLDRYSPEHLKWLSSGYVCQNCKTILMSRWGVADVNCYAANGERVTLALARLKGKVFECPKCNHRWDLRTNG